MIISAKHDIANALMIAFSIVSAFVTGAITVLQSTAPNVELIELILGNLGALALLLLISWFLYKENKKLREKQEKTTDEMIKEYKEEIQRLKDKLHE